MKKSLILTFSENIQGEEYITGGSKRRDSAKHKAKYF